MKEKSYAGRIAYIWFLLLCFVPVVLAVAMMFGNSAWFWDYAMKCPFTVVIMGALFGYYQQINALFLLLYVLYILLWVASAVLASVSFWKNRRLGRVLYGLFGLDIVLNLVMGSVSGIVMDVVMILLLIRTLKE